MKRMISKSNNKIKTTWSIVQNIGSQLWYAADRLGVRENNIGNGGKQKLK
jgi:hypothetical protein